VNALNDPQVADYLNENFVCTYLKVGTFQIVNGQKQGGNVASYFCLPDGSVIHAIPGQVNANKLIHEARWAHDTRKAALTFGTNLETGTVSMRKYSEHIAKAHTERYFAEGGRRGAAWGNQAELPLNMPAATSQARAHWLMARSPLIRLDDLYPTVWTQILGEQLSTLPVQKR
jgi:hypothetical protein